MQIIEPKIEFIGMTPEPLKTIEKAGRTCYKSESRITEDSAGKFVKMLIDRGHTAMIEHANVSYRVICDRGITHELVRHRIASYAQESTRYVNYKKRGISFIKPNFWENEPEKFDKWKEAMEQAENHYNFLVEKGSTPQEARSVLPNSLKTEIVVTMNLRSWRNFFKLRTHKSAHPQMIQIANMLLEDIKTRVPIAFDDF